MEVFIWPPNIAKVPNIHLFIPFTFILVDNDVDFRMVMVDIYYVVVDASDANVGIG